MNVKTIQLFISFILLTVITGQCLDSIIDFLSQDSCELSIEIEENSEEKEEKKEIEEFEKVFYTGYGFTITKPRISFIINNSILNCDFEYNIIDPPPELI